MVLDLVIAVAPLLPVRDLTQEGGQLLGLRKIAGSRSAAPPASSAFAYPFSVSHLASFFVTVPAARRVSFPAITLRTMK
ncbi:MAG: hypothetical protein HY608_05935 [Planctomycetes bacterium]|nr:hypothetical protein [Planctomycetota bacterium]